MAENNNSIDEKGERGGDTGKTKAPRHGEKGDQRRDKDEMTGSVGPTRPGGSGNSRSGSKSNQSK